MDTLDGWRVPNQCVGNVRRGHAARGSRRRAETAGAGLKPESVASARGWAHLPRAAWHAADGRVSGDVLQKYDDRHWKMTAGRDQAWFMLVLAALLLVLAVIAEIAGSDDDGLFMVFWFIPGGILVLQLLVFLFSGSIGLTSVIEV